MCCWVFFLFWYFGFFGLAFFVVCLSGSFWVLFVLGLVFFFFISFLLLLAESKGGNRVTGILYHGLEMGLIQATER